MASRRPAEIAEHRHRFDQVANYANATHKCLLIIGRGSKTRELVGEVQDGIEVVGLAANPAHTSAQKFKYIEISLEHLNSTLFFGFERCQNVDCEARPVFRARENQQAHFSCRLPRMPPARQCRLATIPSSVGLSAEKPCLGLTSSVQSCLPCIHVQEKLSKGRLFSQKNSPLVPHFQNRRRLRIAEPLVKWMDVNWIAVLVHCKDGKEFEIIGNAFKITTSVLDVLASAAPLCEGSPQLCFAFGNIAFCFVGMSGG